MEKNKNRRICPYASPTLYRALCGTGVLFTSTVAITGRTKVPRAFPRSIRSQKTHCPAYGINY